MECDALIVLALVRLDWPWRGASSSSGAKIRIADGGYGRLSGRTGATGP